MPQGSGAEFLNKGHQLIGCKEREYSFDFCVILMINLQKIAGVRKIRNFFAKHFTK
jgi:hypothetical protein